ncbi:MAG: rod shape-determining protein MreD [Gammaproteobacteria bacterium]|nr:rod shape-determining protein MreD [Gammaproteobacteria bacterium]
MKASPFILLLSALLCLILISIYIPPFLQVFYPVWPVIFLFLVFALDCAKYIWFWIWALGLILDCMQHNLLGTHVISMGLVTILLHRYLYQKDSMILAESMILMGFSAVIYLLTLMCIDGVERSPFQYLAVFGQTLASILLWPWLYSWLLKPKKKYHNMI